MTYNSISNKVKKYFEFCTISGPTQLMPAPMRITHAQLLHCFTMSLQDSVIRYTSMVWLMSDYLNINLGA